MSKYKQYLYYGIFPSFLTTGLLVSYYQYQLYQTEGDLIYLLYGFVYLYAVLTSVKWIVHKNKFIYYTGYKFLHIVEWSSIYYTLVILFIYSTNYWYSGFVELVSKSVIFSVSLAVIVICNYYIRKNKYQVIFLKIGDQRYLDFLHFELHTEKQIKEYDVIPIIEEIKDLELFLFFGEKCGKQNFNDKLEINIRQSENATEIIVRDLNDGKEYCNRYITNTEYGKKEQIEQIVKRLY